MKVKWDSYEREREALRQAVREANHPKDNSAKNILPPLLYTVLLSMAMVGAIYAVETMFLPLFGPENAVLSFFCAAVVIVLFVFIGLSPLFLCWGGILVHTTESNTIQRESAKRELAAFRAEEELFKSLNQGREVSFDRFRDLGWMVYTNGRTTDAKDIEYDFDNKRIVVR